MTIEKIKVLLNSLHKTIHKPIKIISLLRELSKNQEPPKIICLIMGEQSEQNLTMPTTLSQWTHPRTKQL